jgi:tripartite-type tricarboxylate transporter receptor subunit TctC
MAELTRRALLAAGTASVLLPTRSHAADSVADFYKGKSIRMLIGAAAAGGYDVAGRAVADHISRYIPGNPAIVVENMPGATSLVMTNYLYNSAARDGTVMGMPNNTVPLEPKLKMLSRDGGNVKFDLSRFNWVGTPVQEPQILWVLSTAARDIDDLRTRKVVMGSTGPGADNYTLPQIVNHVLGTKLEIVTGYQGINEIFLAAERGEVQGNTGGVSNLFGSRPDWVRDGKVRVLMQFGTERVAQLEDVPTAMELATSDIDRDLLRFYALKFNMARPLALPPDVPVERVQALQDAFDATMRDPLYQKEATDAGLDLNPLGGVAVTKLIEEIQATPDAVVDRLRQILTSPAN